jgi:hypothetical protein
MPMSKYSVGVVGLNPGTALYAQYLAKEGYSVTVFTQVGGLGLRMLDYEVHVKLGLLEPGSNVLFTMRYLEDILGINVRRIALGDAEVTNNRVRYGTEEYLFDSVLVGTEIALRSDCVHYADLDPSLLRNSSLRFMGDDSGKALELSMIANELGGTAELPQDAPLDDDMIRQMGLSKGGDGALCVSVDYVVVSPRSNHDYVVGKGVRRIDPMSGLEFTIWRDQLLLIMGKLAAMKELGLIERVPNLPSLEVGFSGKWSFVAIGLPRARLIGAYRDASSSRMTYRWRGSLISSKVNHRGRRILSLQWIGANVSLMNWAYMAYGLLMNGLGNYLILDSGYEARFSVMRGIWEQLILNTI